MNNSNHTLVPTRAQIDDFDRRIMQLRALGRSQAEISRMLGISQPAVSQRIRKIRAQTNETDDVDKVFWTLLLGAGALYLLHELTKRR